MDSASIKFKSDWYLPQIIMCNSCDDLKKRFNAVAETLNNEELHAHYACIHRAFDRYEKTQDAFVAVEALLKQ